MSPRQPAPRIAVPDAIDPAVLRGFDPAAPIITCSGATMGTRWQVRAALPPALGLDAARLGALVQARLDGIVTDMSHWEQTSHLCRFNRAHAGSRIALSPDLATVMADALDIAVASNGAFDPSLGRLTDIWGLGPWKRERDPTAREIAIARAASGWQRLAFDPSHRILRQPGGLWLDLSGIAKGFAVDAVADLLAGHGVYHALVEIGGELAGRGLRPDGDPWWVDIEDPPGLSLPRLRIALHQLSVATSGDYLRGAHTIDPRSGRPAIHDTTAVTVLHPRCMRADGWATALGTLPFAAARQMACDHALIARIVLRDGTEWISPALAAMMEGEDAAAA